MINRLVNRVLRILMPSFLLLCAGTVFAKQDSGPDTRQLISFRKLGHQLLLSAGDSTSRVLSVEEKKGSDYKISFEKPFALIPDTLAAITARLASSSDMQGNYVLAVYRKGYNQLIYGLTSEDVSKGTVPCMGRALPIGEYEIHIQTSDVAWTTSKPVSSLNLAILFLLFILGLSGAGFGMYKMWFLRRSTLTTATGQNKTGAFIAIGEYVYDPVKQILRYGKEQIVLTPKEESLLRIFLKQPNEVIDRNLLLKLGWEDEGVITGRSLDMYVSKLRKKFSQDRTVSFKNVHGKGYSLNIERG